MAETFWYIQLQGGIVGPLSAEHVTLMLQENRLHFTDFAAPEGSAQWKRLGEIQEINSKLPAAPTSAAPAPKRAKVEAPQAPAPKAEPKPEPKKPELSDEDLRFLRVPLEGTVTIKDLGTFKIINFAIGGVLIATKDEPPAIGTEFHFTLKSKTFEKALDLVGMVVRHTRPNETAGFAIEFQRINPAYRKMFETFVRSWRES